MANWTPAASRILVAMAATLFVLAFPQGVHAYTKKTLYSFCSDGKRCKDGWGPGGVVMDSSGNLFGVAGAGGKHGGGVVFEFVPSTGQYTVLHDFCSQTDCKDGENPDFVNLVIDVDGNLYGTTHSGGTTRDGGVVFELARTDTGWHEVALYRFCPETPPCTDGANPYAGLTYAGAAAGQLYDGVSPLFGATYYGGSGEDGTGGTVFSIMPKSGSKQWSEQVLYNFCMQSHCTDGRNPTFPPYIDTQGNLFGSSLGGQSDHGAVFELSPSGSTYVETVLHSFCGENCHDGDGVGAVIGDSQDNLYSVAGLGKNRDGLIFKLSPNGTQWQFEDLANFNGKNGSVPGALIMDASGNLFGTTRQGGAKNAGTVFEFNGSLRKLYSFGKSFAGDYSVDLIEDSAGNFYGVTAATEFNKGTLYELSP